MLLHRSLTHGIVSMVAALAVMAGAVGLSSTANASTHSAYAGPNVFGPWAQVGAHAGAVTYTISAAPVGRTAIVGEVMYFGTDGQRTIEPFYGSKVIRTCNCYGTVQVHFKGLPLGTAVNVNVSP